MTRSKSSSSSPPRAGINYEAILADRAKGVQAHRHVCGCGGKVLCVTITAISETFRCEACKDVVVLLIRQKGVEPPRYYSDEPGVERRNQPLRTDD